MEYLQPPYIPQGVSDLELAFPTHVSRLMPAWDVISPEFKSHRNIYVDWADGMFFGESSQRVKDCSFCIADGIDNELACRHINAILGSFEPSHEHKIAAIAFLLSCWYPRTEDEE